MEILHVSAECFPMAKAGGLADVVGALPKYQNRSGQIAKVVMPMYRTKFLYDNEWELVHEGGTYLGNQWFRFAIIKEKTNKLGFDLYLVDINGLLDRDKIYGYHDDVERFLAFQIAVVNWLSAWVDLPDVVHCHDHQAGLVPFFMKYGLGFQRLRDIKTVFTIHNGEYQGWMQWNKSHLLPAYDNWKSGMLDWNNMINPMASAIKCSKWVTTVSPSYMEELRYNAKGLESLFEFEKGKCVGILNGIDNEIWDPMTDPMVLHPFSSDSVAEGKDENKKALCKQFGLDPALPLFIFIGRLVGEKAAEILPEVIGRSVEEHSGKLSWLILGSGDPVVESELQQVQSLVPSNVKIYVGYNEALAHQMYAGADFLVMPSKVEPCGLNQMYALRYGTVPMVRNVGGLKDTVVDIGEPGFGGYGIVFNHAEAADVLHAVSRAMGWYFEREDILTAARKKMMQIDNSWEKSAADYLNLYSR